MTDLAKQHYKLRLRCNNFEMKVVIKHVVFDRNRNLSVFVVLLWLANKKMTVAHSRSVRDNKAASVDFPP